MLRVTYIERTRRPGTLGALLDAADFIGDSAAVVHPATVLVQSGLREARERLNCGRYDAVLIGGAPHGGSSRGHASLEERRLGRLLRELAGGPAVDTGVRFLSPAFFETARSHHDLGAVLSALVADGDRVGVETTSEWWGFDGTLAGALAGNRRVLEQVDPMVPPECLSDSRVQGRVQIHPTARVVRSTIRGR